MSRLVAKAMAMCVVLGALGGENPAHGQPGLPGAEEPHGVLIVLNKQDDTAHFIAEPGGELIATLPTGRGPHEACVTGDGRLAVAANYEDPARSTLTVYAIADRKVVRTIDLGPSTRPHGLAVVGAGSIIAVTCEGSRELVLVDVAAGEVRARIGTDANGSHMVAVTPDGARAFVPNMADDNVSVIDLAGEELVGLVAAGRQPEGIDISPDGREVWVTNRAEDSITVIDAESLEVARTIPCRGFPIRARVTPDGERVLVSCATAGELAVFDRASGEEVGRVQTLDLSDGQGLGPIGILIPPSGRHAFVANSSRNQVVMVDLVSLQVVSQVDTGNIPDGLAWARAAEDVEADRAEPGGAVDR